MAILKRPASEKTRLVTVIALTTALLTGQALAQAPAQQAAPIWLSENPVFLSMVDNGFTAGDRGVDQPNRFTPYNERFLALGREDQEFILAAYSAEKLAKAPEGKTLKVENGKLAVNLIDLSTSMETLTRFVRTREIPESGKLPRAELSFNRLLRKYPDVATILTPELGLLIADIETAADKAVTELLNAEIAETKAVKAELEAEIAETEASRAKTEAEVAETKALRRLVGRMEALVKAAGTD